MNEYLIGIACAALMFSVGFAFGAGFAVRDRKQKPKVAVQSTSDKAKFTKSWVAVERHCTSCDDTFWTDPSCTKTRCQRCRKAV